MAVVLAAPNATLALLLLVLELYVTIRLDFKICRYVRSIRARESTRHKCRHSNLQLGPRAAGMPGNERRPASCEGGRSYHCGAEGVQARADQSGGGGRPGPASCAADAYPWQGARQVAASGVAPLAHLPTPDDAHHAAGAAPRFKSSFCRGCTTPSSIGSVLSF